MKVGGFNITNSSQTKLTNNNNSVTHKNTGTLGSTQIKTWTVDWTSNHRKYDRFLRIWNKLQTEME